MTFKTHNRLLSSIHKTIQDVYSIRNLYSGLVILYVHEFRRPRMKDEGSPHL